MDRTDLTVYRFRYMILASCGDNPYAFLGIFGRGSYLLLLYFSRDLELEGIKAKEEV